MHEDVSPFYSLFFCMQSLNAICNMLPVCLHLQPSANSNPKNMTTLQGHTKSATVPNKTITIHIFRALNKTCYIKLANQQMISSVAPLSMCAPVLCFLVHFQLSVWSKAAHHQIAVTQWLFCLSHTRLNLNLLRRATRQMKLKCSSDWRWLAEVLVEERGGKMGKGAWQRASQVESQQAGLVNWWGRLLGELSMEIWRYWAKSSQLWPKMWLVQWHNNPNWQAFLSLEVTSRWQAAELIAHNEQVCLGERGPVSKREKGKRRNNKNKLNLCECAEVFRSEQIFVCLL